MIIPLEVPTTQIIQVVQVVLVVPTTQVIQVVQVVQIALVVLVEVVAVIPEDLKGQEDLKIQAVPEAVEVVEERVQGDLEGQAVVAARAVQGKVVIKHPVKYFYFQNSFKGKINEKINHYASCLDPQCRAGVCRRWKKPERYRYRYDLYKNR